MIVKQYIAIVRDWINDCLSISYTEIRQTFIQATKFVHFFNPHGFSPTIFSHLPFSPTVFPPLPFCLSWFSFLDRFSSGITVLPHSCYCISLTVLFSSLFHLPYCFASLTLFPHALPSLCSFLHCLHCISC